jgi:phage gpG-like protein
MFTVSVTDEGVSEAFNRLIAMGENPQGALLGIGEKMLAFTKMRFDLSQDPYGNPWAQNADSTLRAALHRSGKNFTKSGSLSKRGEVVLAGKKPLIGESKSLSTQFSTVVVGNDTVALTSLMPYAAMQNFGGTKAEFPNLWGDIPARQFFPDQTRGLPPELAADISDVLLSALQGAWDGRG